MLFFDLSGMKSFNGKYGYSEGDKLIREVSIVLKNHYTSDFCGRLGQDHFVAYSENDDVEKEIDEIFSEIEKVNDGRTLPVRVGIYTDKYDTVDASMAYDRAKMACDRDRSAHVSKYTHYDMALRKETLTRDYVLSNLEKALSEKRIRAFYQPIMRSQTGNVTDEEALCRWIDPERGIISPLDFIPVLEEAKLIYKLDLYMVDRVLEDFATKKAEGIKPVPVSVNLSRYDFRSCDMVKEICKRMDKARIDRNMLTIEITESFVSADADFLKVQIARFHEAGFKVWMDDFGSGYSSLNALADFDFDLIKFDMIFLRRFKESKKARVILGQLLNMAKLLEVEAVVEGVETAEQMEFLRDAGCDKCQGYYFDRPASVQSVIERIKTGMCFNAELADGTIEKAKHPENFVENPKK
ncbi:MAG: EAL domain-containing protein, partial [Lachnospiraceae bacterium]|nr:EAL domain-containing protein [Lachnospiraceae bacterium]